jgi:hypothetical protein
MLMRYTVTIVVILLIGCNNSQPSDPYYRPDTSSTTAGVSTVKANPHSADDIKKDEQSIRAIKPVTTLSSEGLTYKVSSITTGKRWVFDAYSDEWHYNDAERGDTYIIAKFRISSKEKNPNLLPISLYKLTDGQLLLQSAFRYKLVRWDDYATYLGNYADFNNDFAHTETIPFTCATTISQDELKSGTYYVVVNLSHCYDRHEDRFGNPPISYTEGSGCMVPQALSATDIGKGSSNIVIKVLTAK